MKRIALFGECMIELQGEAFGAMRQTFGGDTLNAAVYLARCGAPHGIRASYATALGDDRFSDGMLARWQAEGIETDLVRRLPGRLPGLYAISVDARGERSFAYWRDSSAARSYFDADPTPLEAAASQLDAIHVSGISLAILAPAARERLFGVLRAVRAHGGLAVFDNNYRPRLWPDAPTARAAFDTALGLADVALLTLDDELLLHGDMSASAALERAFAAPCPEVIVKRGAEPTLVRAAGRPPQAVPAMPVARIVDTTAAGDSFAGAYLAARLAGESALAAAQAGNRLAAAVIQEPGAIIPRERMPSNLP